MSLSLVWLRRDLRTKDNQSIGQALRNSDQIQLVFCFDRVILDRLKNTDDARLTFIYQSLAEIDQELRTLGSELLVLYGDPEDEIPRAAKKLKASGVYTGEDYEPYALRRDQAVAKKLKQNKINLHPVKDQTIFSPTEILKDDGSPYRVFTPYMRRWRSRLDQELDSASASPKLAGKLFERRKLKKIFPSNQISLKKAGFLTNKDISQIFPGGQNEAQKVLTQFKKHLLNYHRQRDYPANLSGTSRLSAHLRFGTVSIRKCVKESLSQGGTGGNTWLSELVWREFYQMILYHFPHSAKGAFKENYNSIRWPGTKSHFNAWAEGRTGYPIVDAGMRQLNQTGWMHNRVRMIVASFLVKDLLCDWRWGEAYFAEKLIDFDLASNNGGWQWCASTGCDAQPYFRIFNPTTQSKKFDPSGDYIRKYVPELLKVDSKKIHSPQGLGVDYPDPIVDHSVQRIRAIQLFSKAK